MGPNKIIHVLGYSGLIPFYLFSIMTALEGYNFFIDIFFLYSAIILCFLSGSLWMKLIALPKQAENTFFKFLSVGFPLVVMSTELFVTYAIKTFVYMLIYVLIYMCDKKTTKNTLLDYMRMRFFLTGNVLLTHLILLYAIFTHGIF
jgi:hypothetical protein